MGSLGKLEENRTPHPIWESLTEGFKNTGHGNILLGRVAQSVPRVCPELANWKTCLPSGDKKHYNPQQGATKAHLDNVFPVDIWFVTNCDKNTDHKKSDILGKSCAHRSTKACENVPDRGAKSVPFHIHRELKIEADLKIICLDDRHFLDIIRCLCAGSLTDEVLLCYIKLVKSVEPSVSRSGHPPDFGHFGEMNHTKKIWYLFDFFGKILWKMVFKIY